MQGAKYWRSKSDPIADIEFTATAKKIIHVLLQQNA